VAAGLGRRDGSRLRDETVAADGEGDLARGVWAERWFIERDEANEVCKEGPFDVNWDEAIWSVMDVRRDDSVSAVDEADARVADDDESLVGGRGAGALE
jgi:hypothetical protein